MDTSKTRRSLVTLIMGVIALGALMIAATEKAEAAPAPRVEFMPCPNDEGDGNSNCVWDAKHLGNGEGHSFFVNRQGVTTRIPHHIAHYLIFGGSGQ